MFNLHPGLKTESDLHRVLMNLSSTGAGRKTRQAENMEEMDGDKASHELIKADLKTLEANKDLQLAFANAAHNLELPPMLLVAIASRETHMGTLLDANWRGDQGQGYGIMQVDQRSHKPKGADLPMGYAKFHANISQAGDILGKHRGEFHKMGYKGNKDLWRFIISSYNTGVGTIPWTFENKDSGTANDDYGSDVLARYQSGFLLITQK